MYAEFHFGRAGAYGERGSGAEPAAGSRGRAPGGESGGQSPLKLKLKAFCCELSKGSSKNWPISHHTFGFAGCQGLFQAIWSQ